MVWVAGWAATAWGGTLRTLDGRTLTGDIQLAPQGCFLVVAKQGKPVKVEVGELLEARFSDDADAEPGAGALPAPWTAKDIGAVRPAGKAGWSNGVFSLRGGGEDPSGRRDAMQFILQPMFGDGEIVARVTEVQGAFGFAGIMLRESIEPDSNFVMLVAGERGVATSHRGDPKRGGVSKVVRAPRWPQWLRIKRNGKRCVFEMSADGKAWEAVGDATVELGDTVAAGLVASGGRRGASVAAVIDQVSVTGRKVREKKGPASEPVLPRGVRTTGGSTVNGEVIRLDRDNLTFRRDGAERKIPRSAVSVMMFADLDANAAATLASARSGVLLKSGDFFQGDVREMRDGRVTVDSILFGPRDFRVGDELLAAALGPAGESDGTFAVRAKGGIALRADAIAIDKNELTATVGGVGAVKVSAGDLRAVRLTGGRLGDLDAVASKRSALEGSVGVDTAAPSIHGEGVAGFIAGTKTDYALGGRYGRLLGQLAVSETMAPTSRLRCTVRGDGRELLKTGEVTSVDDPTSLSLDLRNIQTLSVIVENVDGPFGGEMTLSRPLLIAK